MSDQPINYEEPPKVIEEEDVSQTPAEIQEDRAADELIIQKKDKRLSMEIKISSPFKTYFHGMALSISGENTTGAFDILPKHHNFICLLKPCTLVVRTPNDGEKKIDIGGGLMHVKADKVIIFLDI